MALFRGVGGGGQTSAQASADEVALLVVEAEAARDQAIAAAASTADAAADAATASAAATAAQASETAAAASAASASTSELNANLRASQAAQSATDAATSATSAANSAGAANSSANNAATSAINANNAASAAATSATDSANSATAAAASATAAATSATASADSATDSANSATNASTSEANALQSANDAASSAAQAATFNPSQFIRADIPATFDELTGVQLDVQTLLVNGATPQFGGGGGNVEAVQVAELSDANGTTTGNLSGTFNGNEDYIDAQFKDDGTKLIALRQNDNLFVEWDLSTAYDINALGTPDRTATNPIANSQGFVFSDDGLTVIIASSTTSITQFNVSTAWDTSTIAATGFANFTLAATSGGMSYSTNGDFLYVTELGAAQTIRKYSLPTAFRIAGATLSATGTNANVSVSRAKVARDEGFWFSVNTGTGLSFNYVLLNNDITTFGTTLGFFNPTVATGPVGVAYTQNVGEYIIFGGSGTNSGYERVRRAVSLTTTISALNTDFFEASGTTLDIQFDSVTANGVAIGGGGSTVEANGAFKSNNANAVNFGTNSVVLGTNASGGAVGAVGIGLDSIAGTGSVAIGQEAEATVTNCIAIGNVANATSTGAIAIGETAFASDIDALAIGDTATANRDRAIAIGNTSLGQGNDGIAIGTDAQALNSFAIGLGEGTRARTINSIAIGRDADSVGLNALALGIGSKAAGNSDTFLGSFAGSSKVSGSQNVGIGSYDWSGHSTVSNHIIMSDGNGTVRMTINNLGDTVFSGDVTANSDRRLKSNIAEIEDALEKVNALGGYTYDMNNQRKAGVIAQEVEEVLPEVVNTDINGIKSVAYGNLTALLIEAVKELTARVEELENATTN